MTPLFRVTHCFPIGHSGCVLAPGVSAKPGPPEVHIGSRIRLQAPDGTQIDTHIRGMERVRQLQLPAELTIPIMLPKGITKEQVPVGTLVYLLSGEETVFVQLDDPYDPASGGRTRGSGR